MAAASDTGGWAASDWTTYHGRAPPMTEWAVNEGAINEGAADDWATETWADVVTQKSKRGKKSSDRKTWRNGARSMPLPSTPDLKPTGQHYDEIIRIKVGDGWDGQTFEIYKGVLKFYSGYFRAAILNIESGRFAESKDGIMTLPQDQPAVFEIFKVWVYTRDINNMIKEKEDKWSLLCNLWIFGDRCEIPALQNDAITCLHRHIAEDNWLPTNELHHIYRNTSENSELRRFMVFAIGMRWDCGDSFRTGVDDYSKKFLMDLAAMLIFKPGSLDYADFCQLDVCQWHIHEDGVQCAKHRNFPKMKSSI